MTFLHPEFIYLMLPVLFILFGLLLTQSEPQEQFFSSAVLAKLRVDTNQLSANVRNVFYLLMFVFIIFALADPVIEGGRAKVKAEGGPLYIALDVSRSMLCDDVYPNRLTSAKQQVSALLSNSTPAEVGLLAFAQNSYLVAPATRDHALLRFLLKPLDNGTVSEQGTNVLTLLKAVDKLGKEGRAKRVLIVTDGGDNPDFGKEIEFAKKHRITVNTLGVGSPQGGKIPEAGGGYVLSNGTPVISRLNPGLNTLSTASGGSSLEGANMHTLFGKSSAEGAEAEEKPIYYHLFIVPVGCAMFMLILATSSFYRGEKYYLPTLTVMGLLLLQPEPLPAGLFDYKRLNEAKSSYEKEAFSRSSRIYQQYALENENLEAVYNAANGYYRAGRYKEAVGLYASIHFVEAEKNHQLYHNLGNALVRLKSDDDLKKAVTAYQKALTFREDQNTRENLELVERALRKREDERRNRQVLMPPSAPDFTRASNARPSSNQQQLQASVDLGNAEAGMSDREAAKWFRLLHQHQRATLTKIDVENPEEGNEREKPW